MKKQKGRQWRLWASAVVLFGTALIVIYVTMEPKPKPGDLLLKGPPAFIVLSLVVALSVYLRQIDIAAVSTWDQIRAGGAFQYPLERSHTRAKLKALDQTDERLSTVAPFMIVLTIVIALRIVFDAVWRFQGEMAGWVMRVCFAADLLIVGSMLVVFLALAVLHAEAQRTEKRIRAEAKAYLKRKKPFPQVAHGHTEIGQEKAR